MPFIVAFLVKSFEENDTIYYKEVYVYDLDGFSMIPLVLINDSTIPITDFSYHWYFYSEDKSFATGTEYKLKIKHGFGEAGGRVFVPADFEIIKPLPNFTLAKDSNLYCVWQKATKAGWYYFTLDLYYHYTDTSGQNKFFRFTPDSIVSDTFLVYDHTLLFPSDVDSIISGYGAINLWAVDGSIVIPEASQNISGEGKGFYNGSNHSGERYFCIGSWVEKPISKTKESKERFFKKLRRGFY
jgi:hypothetical protein